MPVAGLGEDRRQDLFPHELMGKEGKRQSHVAFLSSHTPTLGGPLPLQGVAHLNATVLGFVEAEY